METLSDTEVSDELTKLDVESEAAHTACASRPRVDGDYLRRAMYDPKAKANLAKAQADWDAAHPSEAARRSAALASEDKRTALRSEQERRMRKAEANERALSVLDDVPRIKAMVLKGLNDTEAHDAVRDWARADSWCLLMLGGVGCGKSTAAGHYAAQQGLDWKSLPIWARAVEASRMSAFGDTAESRFASWRSCSLLVLDDLGTELVTPTWQQALDDILDYRYQHSARTILPTNLSAEEFKKRYGDRISDRIREGGTVRELAGKSMRRRS